LPGFVDGTCEAIAVAGRRTAPISDASAVAVTDPERPTHTRAVIDELAERIAEIGERPVEQSCFGWGFDDHFHG
jgi:hypothetical protein